MTPFQIIIIAWSLGTCLSFYLMIYDAHEDDRVKDFVKDDRVWFSAKVRWAAFLAIAFIDSFLCWPWRLIQLFRAWKVRRRIQKILKKAEKGEKVDVLIVKLKKKNEK